MKKRLLFVILFLVQLAFGQKENLVKVPGTKCSMIPPDGFVPSTSFSGFQDNKLGASIMISEIPGPYQSTVDGFTAEALKTRGMTLISKETIDFGNSKATLINVVQQASGTTYLKQMLVFGDIKQTVLINGIYPEASKSVEPKIKEALLSTVYNASQDDNPLDAATFTIDVGNTDFKLIKYISGSLIYSTDGQMPTKKPTLIVGNSLAKVPTQNQRMYAEGRVKKLPGGDKSVVKEVNEITIDNLKGYEIVADGKSSDNLPELVYQVMLFNDQGDYYIIVGKAKENFEKYLETFRHVSKTFKRK